MRQLECKTKDDVRLLELSALFAPHVREVVSEEAEKRTLAIRIGLVPDLALSVDPHCRFDDIQMIVDKAILGESRMIVNEWVSLLGEYANDNGRTLRLSELDDAMLPPFPDDLARIFVECCGRRIADPGMTRGILGRVRTTLPGDARLPPPVLDWLRDRGISLLA